MVMRFDTRLFTLAKDPEQPGTYQDACCVDREHHVAAIADGVSSSLFSGPWASILAEAVVADCPNPGDPGEFAGWLVRQRERWAASIDTTGLAWFQKAKLPMGAFSTLLCTRVCTVDDARAGAFGGYRLVAFALGDSCLFQIRGGELVRSFPLESADQFEVDPIVLGSVDLKRDHLLQFAILDEMCYPGDELILCTDAVAEWAVRSYARAEGPDWSDFWRMSEDDWRSGIVWLRQEGQIRIDDSTLLMVRVVDDRIETTASSERSRQEPATIASANPADEPSDLGWLTAASKDLESVAEQVDRTSEQVLKGLRGLKDRAMKKYRETFGKRKNRSE